LAGISKVEIIERERGKPLKDVLLEDFPNHGTLAGLGRSLGVSQGTIQNWLLRYGLQIKIELVELEREKA
jgi:hypothetical protein